MKTTRPFLLAFICSVILSIAIFLSLKTISVFSLLIIPFRIELLIIFISFTLSYLSIFLLVKSYHKKLKEIYSQIIEYRNITPQAKEPGDIIEGIGEQLRQWSVERTYELEQMKRLEAYRKEFLGNVSHELKTPVFNIQGYVLTLLDGAINDPEINRGYLERTEKSVERMISIIDDLEAISQLETGELELEPEKFDIRHLTNEIFEEQELKATGKGIILSFEDKEPKAIYVWADKFRIKQVMTNLIVNSINYGKEYGETVVRFYDVSNKITIEVEDNGIGIENSQIPRLFERFYRVDKSRSREGGGTGLGLSIVKHIIEAHNQTIQVNSKLGEGTEFSFSLLKPR